MEKYIGLLPHGIKYIRNIAQLDFVAITLAMLAVSGILIVVFSYIYAEDEARDLINLVRKIRGLKRKIRKKFHRKRRKNKLPQNN